MKKLSNLLRNIACLFTIDVTPPSSNTKLDRCLLDIRFVEFFLFHFPPKLPIEFIIFSLIIETKIPCSKTIIILSKPNIVNTSTLFRVGKISEASLCSRSTFCCQRTGKGWWAKKWRGWCARHRPSTRVKIWRRCSIEAYAAWICTTRGRKKTRWSSWVYWSVYCSRFRSASPPSCSGAAVSSSAAAPVRPVSPEHFTKGPLTKKFEPLSLFASKNLMMRGIDFDVCNR